MATAYEKETEEKMREVKSLDDSTMGFDEEAKNLHKQLVLQRENSERYSKVLVE